MTAYTDTRAADLVHPVAGEHQGSYDAKDAARYRWLRERLLAADFDWNETGECVLVFQWPSNVAVGGNCDQNIDAAMAAEGAV